MKSRLRLSAQAPQMTLKVSLPRRWQGSTQSSSSEQWGPTAMSQMSQNVVGSGDGRLRVSLSCRSLAQDSPLTSGEGQARTWLLQRELAAIHRLPADALALAATPGEQWDSSRLPRYLLEGHSLVLVEPVLACLALH